MTALEAHIQVLQGVQKIAGYQENMFKKEEIDLHLTRQQNRLVEEIINKTFEDKEIYRDYLRPLVVKNYKLPTYIPNTTESIYEDLVVYGIFPGNYLNLISDRSKVITSNDSRYCADVTPLKIGTLYQNVIEKVGTLGIATPTATSAPYYFKAQVILTISGSPTIVLNVPESLNIRSPKSVFYLINYIQDYFINSDVQVYWETYRGVTYPGQLVFVTVNPNITAVTISFLKPDSSPDAQSSVTLSNTTYRKYVPVTTTNFPGFQVSVSDNLDQESDKLYEQNINTFYKTKKNNPKAVVSADYLLAYESKTFIISELIIDYVRKPKNVSLNLSQGLELSGNGPQIIVDRTVEYLKLAIENPSYQAVLNDNQIRNQI